MNEKLKSCPFCQSDDVAVIDADTSGQMSEYSKVHCSNCLACGPLKSSDAQAIAAWNRRADGWHDMSSAPGDEETPVLLWINSQCSVGLTWRRNDGSIMGKASMFGNATATHWMPLPASPAEAS